MEILKNGEIYLFGTVGAAVVDDEEGFSSIDVRDALAAVGNEDVTVRINSGGGWSHEGITIHNLLRAHKAKVSVVIEGVAASAASVIAMAGDVIEMRLGSFMMVHDCARITVGNTSDHAKAIEGLETANRSIADIYVRQTRRPIAEIRREMAAETWMDANEAVKKRYATKVADARASQPTAFAWDLYNKVPAEFAAIAASARQTHGFGAARTHAIAAMAKAKHEDTITDLIRAYYPGRESDPSVQRAMAHLRQTHPEAVAKALRMGPLSANVHVLPTNRQPAGDHIEPRHNPCLDALAEAIAKQNAWFAIHPAVGK